MLKSVRSRLILASVLWTGGLLMLMHLASLVFIHSLPRFSRWDPHWPVLAGLLAMVIGALAAWASINPLRALDRRVDAVSNGATGRIDGMYPSEVQPLVDRVNALLADREASIVRARAAAGDLAHALKTPLALLAREADAAREAGHNALADAISEQVRRMSAQIDRHLARARIAATAPTGTDRCAMAPCVDALVRTVRRLYAERALDIRLEVQPDAVARIRREDLEEVLGNVLDNACKWARHDVTIAISSTGQRLRCIVSDDGPGLTPAQRATALERGVRLDEAAPGSGLGLAIVRDLTEHYGGSVRLDESAMGGLSVQIELPAAA